MKRSHVVASLSFLVVAALFITAPLAIGKDMTADDLVKEAKKSVNCISVKDAKALHGKNGVVFLDVREPKEYKSGHIPGDVNIPRGLVEFKIEKKIPDKKTKIVGYCKSGGRACLCGLNLCKMGYKDVVNIEGGWKAWAKAGYPVE